METPHAVRRAVEARHTTVLTEDGRTAHVPGRRPSSSGRRRGAGAPVQLPLLGDDVPTATPAPSNASNPTNTKSQYPNPETPTTHNPKSQSPTTTQPLNPTTERATDSCQPFEKAVPGVAAVSRRRGRACCPSPSWPTPNTAAVRSPLASRTTTWVGRGARRVAGPLAVELGRRRGGADHLRALLLGRDPTTDAECCPPTGANGDGIRVTFSAPKSVSLLWAFGSPGVASAASIAHVEAVAVAWTSWNGEAGRPARRSTANGNGSRPGSRRPRSSTGPAGRATPAAHPLRGREPGAPPRRDVRRPRRHPALRVGQGGGLRVPGGAPPPSHPSSALSGGRTATDAGRWPGSTPDGCGRSPNGQRPSTSTWPAPARRSRPGERMRADERHPSPPAPQRRLPHPRGPPGTVADRRRTDRDAHRACPRSPRLRADHPRAPTSGRVG